MRLRKPSVLLIAAMAASAAGAQNWSEQLSRKVELPSHEWLEELRSADGVELNEFTTDGCSGGMSSSWTFVAEQFPRFAEAHGGLPPWEECCVTHDRAYHDAGPDPEAEASYEARLESDHALRDCVGTTASEKDEILRTEYDLTDEQIRKAYEATAAAMYHAVRLGGGPCTGLPWRWGYGYPQCWQRTQQ